MSLVLVVHGKDSDGGDSDCGATDEYVPRITVPPYQPTIFQPPRLRIPRSITFPPPNNILDISDSDDAVEARIQQRAGD